MDYDQRMIESGLKVEKVDLFTFFSPEILQRYALYSDDRHLFRVSRNNTHE